MAKVTGLRLWRNGDIINARDYVYERNAITTALNTNDDTLIDHETRIVDLEPVEGNLNAHIANVSNPHSVTKAQVGLSNVDNTTDANKPVSTATQTALNLKANLESPTFTGTVSGITKTMVGLPNVDNTTDANKPISTATQTALDLKADLVDGKVPAAQLPSYVDDVLEVYVRTAATPLNSDFFSLTSVTGTALTAEAGKIYLVIGAVDTNLVNTTYRWGGTHYAVIGDIALGTTAATAFPGDRGLATETKTNNIVSGVQGLTDTRITNSAIAVRPLTINAITSTTADLQSWQVNSSQRAFVDSAGGGRFPYFGSTGGANNSFIELPTTGTLIRRNINDATNINPALTVNQQLGAGDITRFQFGGANKLEVTKDGFLNQNGTRLFTQSGGTTNTFFGVTSGGASSSGANNTAFGNVALQVLSSGSDNTAFGRFALGSIGTASNSTGVGSASLVNASGAGNTAVGRLSGNSLTSGTNNTFLGFNAGNTSQLATATNSTALGFEAFTDASNQMVFGNASVTQFKFDRNASATILAPQITASSGGIHTIERTTANTNTTAGGFITLASTNGDMADGFGVLNAYSIRDNAPGAVVNNIANIGALRSGADNSGRLVFQTSIAGTNTEKMTILPNGNIGVGTGSPARLLELVTYTNNDGIHIRRSSTTTNDYASLGFRITTATENTSFAEIRAIRTNRAVAADTDLAFHTYSNTTLSEKMRIRDDGLVGINETTISAQLQVKSGATTRVPLIVDTLASHTAILQAWRVNGATFAYVSEGGRFASKDGIQNNISPNNSYVITDVAGTTIYRDVADTNPSLRVNLQNSSATGNIAVFQKAGITLANVANNGDIYAPRFIANPSSGGSDTAGAWGISDYNDKLSAVRDYITDTYYPIYHEGNKPTVTDISATGTPSSSTFLRGDGTWENPDVFSYATLASSTSRQDTTYTTFLTSATMDANSRYEVEISVIFYKTSTASARHIEYNIVVNNTTGTPTLQLVGSHSNIGTGSSGMNFYVASTSAATGTTHTTLPSQTGAYTRIFNITGIIYTGTSTKTISIQDRASATLTGGEVVGSGTGSYIKVRKVM